MAKFPSQDKAGARLLASALHASRTDVYDTATCVERERLAEYGEWLAAHYYEIADISETIPACDLLCYETLEERIVQAARDSILEDDDAMDMIRAAIDAVRKDD